ncbi:MAG: type II secretion system protein GspG [Thermoguttaceae bacterium]
MKEHRQAPPSLSVLPVDKGPYGKAVDGWGNDLGYSVDRDGVIILTSVGADGKPGGDGRDADIIMRYRTRNADGTLNVGDDAWIDNAKIE